MKRILLSIVAVFFPWIIIFSDDNPMGGLLALFLQATIIGWIPATIWAWRIVHRPEELVEEMPAEPTKKPAPPKPRARKTVTKPNEKD